MVKLRNLEIKDAPLMLEWMTDPDIVRWFQFDSKNVNLDKCVNFITHSRENPNTKHFAVCDAETDTYLGTISLKNIDLASRRAEYAISMRKNTHGTGAAYEASRLLMDIAFNEYALDEIYLYVLAENIRANKFYNKIGFHLVRNESNTIPIQGKPYNLNWYSMTRTEYDLSFK